MDVVFDVNVLVSALITKGKPKELWLRAVGKGFDLVCSREILDEFMSVAGRQRITRYIETRDVVDFLQTLSSTARFVDVKSKIKVVKEDTEDDLILATAYDGRAEYIVSGDRHLLKLKTFRGIKIITVDQALRILKKR